MRRPRAALLTGALLLIVAPVPGQAAGGDVQIATALVSSLHDARTDVVLIDQPAVPGAPRVRGATRVNASPATVRAALLDAARYPAIIPSLARTEVRRGSAGVPFVDWELEVPLFNLSGRFALRAAGDQVRLDLFEGDFAPGHLVFTIAGAADGGALLSIDAVMDVRRSTWILRRILKRSPFGEPAALAAAAYVALRAVALRAEHANDGTAWRPAAPPAPPPDWQPPAALLAAAGLAPARAAGILALVARQPDQRLAGVAAAVSVDRPATAIRPALRDPHTWRAFPGWQKVQPLPGPGGTGARVQDNLPLVDLDATYAPEAEMRWIAVDGATRGARLGFGATEDGPSRSVVTVSTYPRLELTGSVARRFIHAEPLLEAGLALAVGFVEVASVRGTLVRTP